MPESNVINVGLFIPLLNVYDAASIYRLNVNQDEFKRFLVSLIEDMRQAATAVNLKETGYYIEDEFVTGNLFYPTADGSNSMSTQAPGDPQYRPSFRKTINFGALPNGGVNPTRSVPHGLDITNTWRIVKIEAVATDPVALIALPLPYATPTITDAIALNVDSVNVNITVDVTKDYSSYSAEFIILEFIKF